MKDREIIKVTATTYKRQMDVIAIEEPLEIRIRQTKSNHGLAKPISVTMRTPGADMELALGFLLTEGIIGSMQEVNDVLRIDENIVCVDISDTTEINTQHLQRNFYTTSSCGVCGKSSIDAIRTKSKHPAQTVEWTIPIDLLYGLQAKVRRQQLMFSKTGGIHSAAFFDRKANLVSLSEDVGRHNALDKLIGRFLQAGNLPLTDGVLFLSGRASFELIQKATMVGVSVVTAVGAPSSLAVELAEDAGITLIGFLKEDSCNVYTYPTRISYPE